MAMLHQIDIHGYRSIKDLSLELHALNVLIGANGAGKSNFVSFFKLLNEMMAGRLQVHIGRTGRPSSVLHFGSKITPLLNAKLQFRDDSNANTYSLCLEHVERDALMFREESLDYKKNDWQGSQNPPLSLGGGHEESRIGEFAAQGNQTAKVFLHLLNRCRGYHFHDTSPSARIRQACYINDNRWLMPDAGNLAAMLFAYRQRSEVAYRRIVSTIRKVVPEFDDFVLEPSRLNANDIFLNWRKRGWEYLFGPHQLSDGSLRAMAICTLLLQPEDELPDVIVLDEPELGLHPYALEIVAGLLRAASTQSQIIVATQSQTFLNYFAPCEIVTVECRKGQSLFRRLDEEQLRDWLEDYSVGELWQRNVLGGGVVP